MMSHRYMICAATFGLTLLAGCATPPPVRMPAALDLPGKTGLVQTVPSETSGEQPDRRLTQTPTPEVGQSGPRSAGMQVNDVFPPMYGGPVSVNVQNVPVPLFANEVFGNLLDLNVSMDPAVAQLQELVTLRTDSNQKPEQLYSLARQILGEYGVLVKAEGNLVKLSIGASGDLSAPPMIISGYASPAVPISHRPVFQLIELEVVSSGDAVRWLSTLFGTQIKVLDEASRNSIIISGKPNDVKQAVEALRVFDRPLMRGRMSTRLEPAFLTAEQLTDRLIDVLNVQGYSANRAIGSPSSVVVLPVTAVNSVLVFATTQQTLDYAVSWARELDRPSQQAGSQSMFYYQVKNTKAADLATVLGSSMTNAAKAGAPAAEGAAAPAAPASAQAGSLIVDEPRNALIFQGNPTEWERMLSLIRQMDRAPRQVMVEVTIAEVKLNDSNEFGISWFAKNGFDRFNGRTSFGNPASGGSSSGGLTYLLDIAGQNRVALDAFAQDSRVSILSTPRLLVKSGSSANIQVGEEVPTVTMTTTSDQQNDGNSNLLQSIQYRKTGVILEIKPTVYSNDRIDLDITQEVSSATPGATPNSPIISNRSLTTSLTLRDGGSVVMAGLIKEEDENTDSGIPLLKDVPLLGNLFKNQSRSKIKTELVLMIIPYIIETHDQAASISQAIINRMETLELDQVPLQGPMITPSRPSAYPVAPPPLPAGSTYPPAPRTYPVPAPPVSLPAPINAPLPPPPASIDTPQVNP